MQQFTTNIPKIFSSEMQHITPSIFNFIGMPVHLSTFRECLNLLWLESFTGGIFVAIISLG